MLRRNFLKNIGLLSAASTVPVSLSASGLQDSEENIISGKVSSKGKGIANVVVSDGYNVVKTGSDGSYRFTANRGARFVHVSLPSGYQVPHEKGIARFYKKIEAGNIRQVANFDLEKGSEDDKHAFIVWGDTQIQSEKDAELLKTISAPDTKACITTLGNLPVHGIGCGDLVFDKFELFEDYKEAVAITGIPYFQLIGNHDMDYTARTDEGSQATYESHFGPTWYSFNRGKIHYVVLDDVFFIGLAHRYIGYLTETQLSWLEKDLRHVAAGTTVVVCLHIPTWNGVKVSKGAKEADLGGMVSNREALYALLKDYKVHIMSGHTHYNENWEKGNIMEHNHGTVCGAWWTGPVCGDGTPNGYGVYTVDGDNISWYYKSVGFDKTHQLSVYGKNSVKEKPAAVMANVWNYDPAWKVEWLEDGVNKGSMEQYSGQDPQAVALYLGPQLPAKHTWVEPVITNHLFIATPSETAKEIVVKATDRFGNVYTESIKN
ncbi:calcineurin-like phosphoesterase family protein [Ferruginibacter sp. HRS2-29]|uniref:calcineurin-like phosphoesterase C-terminal domain-containing protein n=1 Tax=Ferruginibacter sp. HRS2-29 TaxID=2487334 RepID=UPI0020CBBA0E|nr:calcineurin-like phosphoesterase family protein [Ferruginibacter sp. HRS2-29]MCP9753362.1 metallophosphoesterase [Ferruginibacter sp. HRS2-29]